MWQHSAFGAFWAGSVEKKQIKKELSLAKLVGIESWLVDLTLDIITEKR